MAVMDIRPNQMILLTPWATKISGYIPVRVSVLWSSRVGKGNNGKAFRSHKDVIRSPVVECGGSITYTGAGSRTDCSGG